MAKSIMNTKLGLKFVEFMRGEGGKKIDKVLVRTTGFSLLMRVFSSMANFPPHPVLMLYTIGAKSGEKRSTVMPYVRASGRLYLVGSNGAKANDPAWVYNVMANPDVQIVIDRKKRSVKARRVAADTPEYEAVWTEARALTPQYDTYQSQTTRQIPVVALE